MKAISWIVMVTVAGTLWGQAKTQQLPNDIAPDSHSRLPFVHRQDLDAEGQKVWDSLTGNNPDRGLQGALAVAIYNPGMADALSKLRTSVVRDGTLGNHIAEVAILTGTREAQMSSNEWTPHEATALKAGVAQVTIDAIKERKDLTGIPEKDALVIRFGRELLRDRHVSSETFAKAVDVFGRRGTVELAGVMGYYAMAALLMEAVDEHRGPERLW
jgi:4-carboxymuconolactone decarboxylase